MNKILIIANDSSTIFNFRIELIKKLVKNYIVIISVPENKKNIYFEKLGCIVDQNIISRFSKNLLKEIRSIIQLNSLIKKHNPKIILTFTIKPNIYVGLINRFRKSLFFPNITGVGSSMQKVSFFSKFLYFLYRVSLNNAKMVFFQNQTNLNLFKKKNIVKNNFTVIPGSGVNTKSYSYTDVFNFNPISFIIVSRIRYDKGFDELVQAIIKISETQNNVVFNIVGSIEEKKYEGILENICKKYNVIYHGHKDKDEVAKLMKESTCLIHPSHHEGMSNVILEASALGRPSIVSNIPGCREIIKNNISGFLFEVKSANDLIKKIKKFTILSRSEIILQGQKARINVEENFNRTSVNDTYIKFIERYS